MASLLNAEHRVLEPENALKRPPPKLSFASARLAELSPSIFSSSPLGWVSVHSANFLRILMICQAQISAGGSPLCLAARRAEPPIPRTLSNSTCFSGPNYHKGAARSTQAFSLSRQRRFLSPLEDPTLRHLNHGRDTHIQLLSEATFGDSEHDLDSGIKPAKKPRYMGTSDWGYLLQK